MGPRHYGLNPAEKILAETIFSSIHLSVILNQGEKSSSPAYAHASRNCAPAQIYSITVWGKSRIRFDWLINFPAGW
jgi:hypothetical protein